MKPLVAVLEEAGITPDAAHVFDYFHVVSL